MAAKASIRTVLIALMVVQTSVVGVVVSSLSLRFGRQSVDVLAYKLAAETGERVDREVEDLLHTAQLVNEVNADAIVAGNLMPMHDDVEPFEQIFVRTLGHFPVTLAFLGLEDGSYVGSRRYPDGSMTLSQIAGNGDQRNLRYRVEEGRRGAFIEETGAYDARTRPWYKAAVQAGEAVWTEPYIDFGTGGLGITAALPLKIDGRIVGALGTDMLFEHLEAFLTGLELAEGSRVFVMDQDGKLISTSVGIPVNEEGSAERVRAIHATDDTIREAARALAYKDLALGQLQVQLDDRAHYVHIAPVHMPSLRWQVVVLVPRAAFMQHIDTNLRWTVITCLLAVLAAALTGAALTRRISQPLRVISEQMEEVARLSLNDQPIPPSLIDEVAVIQESLDSMKRGLRSFEKYVPVALVRRLVETGREAVLGVEQAEVTLFFSDIAGFTGLAERLGEERLVEVMSAYLGEMSTIVLDNGGTLDKYIGDAIMAFWNAPDPVADHPLRALETAMACQARLVAMRAEDGDWPELHTRIGLHMGRVLVGNFGSPQRMDYTALGDAVNLASRLEALNKTYGTGILVSEAVAEATRDHVLLRRIDRVAVKGRTEPTRVYAPVARQADATEAQRALVAGFETALDRYFARDFAGALEVLATLPGADGPAQTLAERCRSFLREPPPADWDGTYVQRTK